MFQNNEWINKEKFDEIFPRGYRECNFFSPSIECWSMSKEEAFRKRERTALLDLSSYLKKQRNLQPTYSIGHSSDTVLLTELLNLKNNTLNNNLNILIDSNKKCYTCNNVCKCSILMPIRLKKHLLESNSKPVLSLSKIVLPEIQLIEKFDRTYIKSSVRKPNLTLPNYIFDTKDVSVNNIGRENLTENCYDTFDMDYDINKNIYWENSDIIIQTNKPESDDRIGVIHDDSIIDRNDDISINGFGITNISDNEFSTPENERDRINEDIVWDDDDTLILYNTPEININLIESTEQNSQDDSTNDCNDISKTGFGITNISENECSTPENERDRINENIVWDDDDTLMLYTPEINVIERTTEQIVHDSTNNENNEYNKIIYEYFNLNSFYDIFQDQQDDSNTMMM